MDGRQQVTLGWKICTKELYVTSHKMCRFATRNFYPRRSWSPDAHENLSYLLSDSVVHQ